MRFQGLSRQILGNSGIYRVYAHFSGPRPHRVGAAIPARWPRDVGVWPPRSRHRSRIDQPREVRRFALRRPIEQQLINERLPPHATVHEHVFQAYEPVQVHPQLRIREPRVLAQLAAAKAVRRTRHILSTALRIDHFDHARKNPAGLRRQLIERATQDLVRQGVRLLDVRKRRLDVLDRLAVLSCSAPRALILMQERDRIDEGQIFFVIAPRTGLVREEREPIGVRI